MQKVLLIVALLVPSVALAQVGELASEGRSLGEWLAIAGTALGALVAFATVIAGLTPNVKDDEIVGFIKKLVDKLSVGGFNVGPDMGGSASKK